jgi:PAS domain S-box-containing protein
MTRPRLLGSPLARYGLAAGIMLLAVLLRAALVPVIGLNVPYLTVYPAMMIVAVTLGFGPGVFATVAGVLLAEQFFMPPTGALEWDLSFGVRAVIVLAASLYLARIGRDLRAARARAEAEAAAARATEAALRQQVQLVDPARAEVILREMQRVVHARSAPADTPAAPSGVWLARVPDGAGWTVAAVGLLAMTGWAFDVAALKSVVPGLATMKFNTALCFMLAGAALALRRRRALRLAGAAAVGLVAGLSLIEYLTGAGVGIDQLIIHDPGDPHTVPGRMAQATAVAFLFSSAALLLLGARTPAGRRAQQVLALGAGLISLVALLGYAYAAQKLYRFGTFSTMALPTAAALTLLAAGLLCARTDGWVSVLAVSGPGGRIARRLLPTILLLPPVLGWLHTEGERTGFHDSAAGAVLLILGMMLSLAALLGWTARLLNREDAARRETEAQLRNQVALMNQAQEPLIVRELGGIIRFWNRGAEALYGWPAADAVGQRTHILLGTTGVAPEQIEAQLEIAGRWEGELNHTAREGRRITVESRQTATRAADGRLLILESNRDVTARKLAEEEIRRKVEELHARNAELTRLGRAMVGRELRMVEMKKEVNALCAQAGQPPRYSLDFEKTPQ